MILPDDVCDALNRANAAVDLVAKSGRRTDRLLDMYKTLMDLVRARTLAIDFLIIEQADAVCSECLNALNIIGQVD